MRQIKFRGWNKDTNKMIDEYINVEVGRESANLGAPRTYTSIKTYHNSIIEDIIPMQYIGLIDKNSTEIYEGDILGIFNSDDKSRFVVKYNVTSFVKHYIGHKYPVGAITQFDLNEIAFEVIGNIYENPKLLL